MHQGDEICIGMNTKWDEHYSPLSGGLGRAGFMAGLKNLKALSQYKPSCDSFLSGKPDRL